MEADLACLFEDTQLSFTILDCHELAELLALTEHNAETVLHQLKRQ